jgi:hypothetical protein
MAPPESKRPKTIFVTGYHGTRKDVAQQILDSGFKRSENNWEWLGHGVYFWQDGPTRAREWARTWLARQGYDGPIAVMGARISLRGFVDLLDQEGMRLLVDAAATYQQELQAANKSLTNRPPLNRLDCALFNFSTNWLTSLGMKLRGYRAACVEGEPITPHSPIYDCSHVQLAVTSTKAIRRVWIEYADK